MRILPWTATVLTALPALVVAAAPAPAAPLERVQLHFADSFVDDQFCGVDTARVEYNLTVNVVINPHGPDGIAYYLETVHGFDRATNLASGEGVLKESDFQSKDEHIVDNGDGTFTIEATVSGSDRITWSNGPTLLNAGLRRVLVLIDHGGTPTDPDDDEFIAELDRAEFGRHDTTGRPGFCTDWESFT